MKKLVYDPNAVCFQDYEVGDKKVFLELFVKEERGVFEVNLLPKYPDGNNTHVIFRYDGEKLIAKTLTTTFHHSVLSEAYKRIDDIKHILKDKMIIETVEDIVKKLS